MISRRNLMKAAACAPAAGAALAAAPRNVVISSVNGLRACARAMEMLAAGQDTLDAVIAGVNINEEDPNDDSVGYGGLPNEEGVVELDACVMDGTTGLGGAVAALRNIKNPAQVALKVMRHTRHVLLVGEGALRFARSMGFKEEDLLTEASRKKWLEWRARRSDHDDWLEPRENTVGEQKKGPPPPPRPTGTIHVGCVDASGDIGGATSTSGLAFKIP